MPERNRLSLSLKILKDLSEVFIVRGPFRAIRALTTFSLVWLLFSYLLLICCIFSLEHASASKHSDIWSRVFVNSLLQSNLQTRSRKQTLLLVKDKA